MKGNVFCNGRCADPRMFMRMFLDQRLERNCFPANIYRFSCLEFVSTWQAPKGVGCWPFTHLPYDANHCKSAAEPQDLQAAAYRKLQAPGHCSDVISQEDDTATAEKYRSSTARLRDAQKILFQNTKELQKGSE